MQNAMRVKDEQHLRGLVAGGRPRCFTVIDSDGVTRKQSVTILRRQHGSELLRVVCLETERELYFEPQSFCRSDIFQALNCGRLLISGDELTKLVAGN